MWDYKPGFTLDKVVDVCGLDFVSYISADTKYIGDLNRFRGVHVIRDPRDIAVSAYFSHRNSHSTEYWPELIGFRQILQKLPKDEGLLENMKFTDRLPIDGWDVMLFDQMKDWNYKSKNVLEMRFEDLVRDPYQKFLEMFDFLGILEFIDPPEPHSSFDLNILRGRTKLPAWVLLLTVYRNRFAKLAGSRKVGEEDDSSHYRKGLPGDWRNHFNETHKRYFKEHFNDLLVKLGYEADDNW
jgi:hypothetical protein